MVVFNTIICFRGNLLLLECLHFTSIVTRSHSFVPLNMPKLFKNQSIFWVLVAAFSISTFCSSCSNLRDDGEKALALAMQAYGDYFNNKLSEDKYNEAEVNKALEKLPKIA